MRIMVCLLEQFVFPDKLRIKKLSGKTFCCTRLQLSLGGSVVKHSEWKHSVTMWVLLGLDSMVEVQLETPSTTKLTQKYL